MEALRIIKTITSDRLPELNNYKGKNVEIIILSEMPEKEEKNGLALLNELNGSCPDLLDGMEFQNKIRAEWNR